MENKKEVATTKMSVPSEMIQLAISKGADLDKLEKLLSLQEKWEANEAKKAYNKAMSEFKANPPEIDKDRKVTIQHKNGPGQTKYNHASLYNVTKKISSELSKYGLSASWTTKQNAAILVTCKITHIKGHSEETTLSAPADNSGSKNAIQAIGSTITYLERYTLLALTGLATFEQDDDGQAATVEYINKKQVNEILDWTIKKNIPIEKFCKAFNVETPEKLPKEKFRSAITALEKAKGGKK